MIINILIVILLLALLFLGAAVLAELDRRHAELKARVEATEKHLAQLSPVFNEIRNHAVAIRRAQLRTS